MRKSTLSDLAFRLAVTLGLFAALLWISSCNANGKPESDQQIQQQAQQVAAASRSSS